MMMIDEYIKAWRSYQKAANEEVKEINIIKNPQDYRKWCEKYPFWIVPFCTHELNLFFKFVKENFGEDGE